jgi:hypothetical protein
MRDHPDNDSSADVHVRQLILSAADRYSPTNDSLLQEIQRRGRRTRRYRRLLLACSLIVATGGAFVIDRAATEKTGIAVATRIPAPGNATSTGRDKPLYASTIYPSPGPSIKGYTCPSIKGLEGATEAEARLKSLSLINDLSLADSRTTQRKYADRSAWTTLTNLDKSTAIPWNSERTLLSARNIFVTSALRSVQPERAVVSPFERGIKQNCGEAVLSHTWILVVCNSIITAQACTAKTPALADIWFILRRDRHWLVWGRN